MKLWQLLTIVLCVLLLASCRTERVRAAASATAAAATPIDPVVTLAPDRTEVGPGETITWTLTTSVPTTETERARQVEVVLTPAPPLTVTAAAGPTLKWTHAESYVDGLLSYSTDYAIRYTGQTSPIAPAADGASVRIPLGDIDPGGSVTATVETTWQ